MWAPANHLCNKKKSEVCIVPHSGALETDTNLYMYVCGYFSRFHALYCLAGVLNMRCLLTCTVRCLLCCVGLKFRKVGSRYLNAGDLKEKKRKTVHTDTSGDIVSLSKRRRVSLNNEKLEKINDDLSEIKSD